VFCNAQTGKQTESRSRSRPENETMAGNSTHNKPTSQQKQNHNRDEISLPSTPVNYPIHDALYATSYAVQS
jgi:hypothetical protein